MGEEKKTILSSQTLVPVAAVLALLGAAVTAGVVYQRINTLEEDHKLLAGRVEIITAKSETDGDRLTRTEANYAQIIQTLIEIKADLRELKR